MTGGHAQADIGGNQNLRISGSSSEAVGGSQSLTIGTNQTESIGQDLVQKVGKNVHQSAGIRCEYRIGKTHNYFRRRSTDPADGPGLNRSQQERGYHDTRKKYPD